MTTDTLETCPMCEEGLLEPFDREEILNFRGGPEVAATLEYSRCSECGSELTTPAQTKSNQRRITDAKRQKEGLLTGHEIKALREHLGLTQSEASETFGGGPNAFSKYERGIVSQSIAMDRLMRVVGEVPQVFGVLAKIASQENFRFRINSRVSERMAETRSDVFPKTVIVVAASRFHDFDQAKLNDSVWVTDAAQEPVLRVVSG